MAETTQRTADFDIFECADLEEAMQVAASHPVTRIGAIEFCEFGGLIGIRGMTGPTAEEMSHAE